MSQTLHLDKITRQPIKRAPRIKGRDIDFGSGPVSLAGLGNWHCPVGKVPPSEMVAIVKAHGGNTIWGWSVSSRHWAGETWELPWAFVNGRYDLTKRNPKYYAAVGSLADQCEAEDIVLIMMALEGHYEWASHPLNPAMNRQGINGGPKPFAEPTADGWSVIAPMLNHLATTLAATDNAFMHIKCEGIWNTKFHGDCHNVVGQKGVLTIASSKVGGPAPDALKACGSDGIEICWPDADGNGKSGGFMPLIRNYFQINNEDHVGFALQTRSAAVAYSHAMTGFLSGHQFLGIDPAKPLKGHAGKPWNDQNNPANKATRDSIGIINAWSQRIRLADMEPRRDYGSGVARVSSDKRQILMWLYERAPVTFHLPPGNYRVEWFDCASKKLREIDPVQGGGDRTFSPSKGAVLLHVVHEDVYVPFPEAWMTGGTTDPPPPPPPSGDGDGTGRASQAIRRIDSWLDLPSERKRKRQIKKLEKARKDLALAIKRATD